MITAPETTTATTGALSQETPARNCIILFYHEADLDLLPTLDQYLQLMYRRLGPGITRHYYSYPKTKPQAPTKPAADASKYQTESYQVEMGRYEQAMKTYQEKRKSTIVSLIRKLEQAALFLPCLTNTFLTEFWNDMEQTPELAARFQEPAFQIMPLFIRPTETGIPQYTDPLSAYEGYQRDAACQQLASMIEAAILTVTGITPAETPVTALFTSAKSIRAAITPYNATVRLLQDALAPISALVEQSSAQIVESRQLALAERTQRIETQENENALREQIETLTQHVAELEEWQHLGFFARLRRRNRAE